MVSTRLDELIREPIERTYLAGDDGYWADLVLHEFTFLEDRGGRLADVKFHQKGDYIRYVGPWGSVVLEFFPDGDWISASAQLRGELLSFEGDLKLLSRLRQPDAALPSSIPRDRATIAANVTFAADLLRSTVDLFGPTN